MDLQRFWDTTFAPLEQDQQLLQRNIFPHFLYPILLWEVKLWGSPFYISTPSEYPQRSGTPQRMVFLPILWLDTYLPLVPEWQPDFPLGLASPLSRYRPSLHTSDQRSCANVLPLLFLELSESVNPEQTFSPSAVPNRVISRKNPVFSVLTFSFQSVPFFSKVF